MPAISDDALKTALAASLKLSGPSALVSSWTEIVTWANATAQAQIRQALANMGYPPATADGWDDFAVYNEMLGLFWCGIRGRAYVTKDQAAALNALDCRPMLDSMSDIRVGGVVVFPLPTTVRVRSGVLLNPPLNKHPNNPLLYQPEWPWGPRLNP